MFDRQPLGNKFDLIPWRGSVFTVASINLFGTQVAVKSQKLPFHRSGEGFKLLEKNAVDRQEYLQTL